MELYELEPEGGALPAFAPVPEEPAAELSHMHGGWELFRPDGHLTDEGLAAVVEGTLDEMGRLETSEHLSFCDSCLVRYTALLTDDMLLTPAAPVAESVCQRVRRRSLRVVRGRTARAAAAAVLALSLWSSGVFLNLIPTRDAPQAPPPMREPFSASAYINGLFRSAGDSISSTLNEWFSAALPAKAAP